ncbi:unnamed protein product [Rotaria magnacalcarata]|uniref:Uncharacterized protein n=3 Tax=Rotaria magnacalcarata TaxID=392030 RepID=A0A819AC41_9BILA|nr:unnamed protein product [Rotaria magnacalcarata]CAF3775661.1 unnamed protein product [Rotaria magnacalcarata]
MQSISSDVVETVAQLYDQRLRDKNVRFIPQYPSMISSTTTITVQMPQHESVMVTAIVQQNRQFQNKPDGDNLPSYIDLFAVPSSCKQARTQHQTTRITNQ